MSKIKTILTNITYKKDNLFDKNQINLLTNLKLGNEFLFDINDLYFFYEFIYLFKFYRDNNPNWFNIVFSFLNNNWLKYFKGTNNEIRKKIIYLNPLLNNLKVDNLIDLDILKNQNISQEGIYSCRKCGSKETISIEKQVRSADEPATVLVSCIHCKHVFRIQ